MSSKPTCNGANAKTTSINQTLLNFKPMVSKTSEADIWLSSYDHLTDVGGQRGGCQQLLQRKGACFKWIEPSK